MFDNIPIRKKIKDETFMADKPVKKKKIDITKLRKKLLDSYLEIKRAKKNQAEVLRDEFVEKTEFNAKHINKVFGAFRHFRYEGEQLFVSKLPQSERALLSERDKKFDPFATTEDCINDLRDLQHEHPAKSITRNFYRENGTYSDSTWNSLFGTFQEFRRQAGIELSRKQHKIEREIAKHASVDHYKKFYVDKILPYYKKYPKKPRDTNIKKIFVMSDIHDEEADDFCLSVAIDTAKKLQPDIIVLNGDIYDLYEFSRYNSDPRRYDIKARFDFVKYRIFKPLREACPNAQIDLIIGNHELRLLTLLADATPNIRILLADVMNIGFEEIFGLDEFQINWVSKFNLAAFTKKDIENELKNNYQIYYGCYVVCHEPDKSLMVMSGTNGHHHTATYTSTAYIDPYTQLANQVSWVQTPAIHVRDAEYLKNLGKWNMGFLEVTVNVKEKQVVQKIHQVHTNWAEIHGVYYERKDFQD